MLSMTVIEISPFEGYSIIRVQLGSESPDVTVGDVFNLAVIPAIADLNEVGEPLVLEVV